MDNEKVCSTTDIWLASILQFVGCDLLLIDIEGTHAKYTFDCPRLDFEAYVEDYRLGQLALSDAKAFVNAFNVLAKQVKEIRLRDERSWASPTWISGKAG